MTATAEPSAEKVEAPQNGGLDRAEGIELLGPVHGSGYKDGAALVRRADGQVVQLGPLMYALLESLDGKRNISDLTAALSERVERGCDEQHVRALAEKLAAQGLLAGTEENAPPRRNPLLALRWKVLVTNTAVTRRLTAPFAFLFRPWILWPMLACFVGVCWFVLIHKGVATATAEAFHSPELLLLVFVLAIFSAGFHELGHAAACRYGGATPGGMGMGIYMVWPAFYTDVTDAYRLPKRDRLRVDLGGLYFNAVVAVATVGVWLAWHVDALLLLVALQLLQMVKQLSPIIRADGYHILSDATGIPDLFAHIGPTLRRLIPGRRREPSALTGRARFLVTAWVLIVVPVLLSLMIGAVIILPRLLTTAWDSGRAIITDLPHQGAVGVLAGLVRLLALALPVLGCALVSQKIVRTVVDKGEALSEGRPVLRAGLIALAVAALAGTAWALWPAGQYQPVRASARGTLTQLGTAIASPTRVARPSVPILGPGTYLAAAMVPVDGATKEYPGYFVIPDDDGDQPVILVSDSAPPAADAPSLEQGASTTTPSAPPSDTTQATAFPFKLPSAPGPGSTQAVAVGSKDGGVTYKVAYAVVTVSKGAPVTNTNSAFAFASCKGCTTVAVSFQIVLVVGESKIIAPINAAGALNVNCPACMTTAIADQIVVTLTAAPSQTLVQTLETELKQLDALPSLGANGTPAAVAAQVTAVQQQVQTTLQQSGLLPKTTSTTTTTTPTTSTASSTTTSTTETATTTATTETNTTPTTTTTGVTTTTASG